MIAASPQVAEALVAIQPPPQWIVQALTVRRRQFGLTVTDWEELFDADQVRKEPFYQDVVRPQRLLAPVTMLMETGEIGLPAALSVYFSDEQAARRHAYRRKELLRLLFPAFCAGLKTYLGFRRNWAALAALAEDARIGVLFFDTRSLPGRENEFFRRLMENEPERDRVRAEVARVIRGIFRFPAFDGLSAPQRRANAKVQTRTARYKIAATYIEDQWSPDVVKAIALVERIHRESIPASELAARFSLTKREIETAHLLRRGLPSREIAAQLDISVNTARRHIERVLQKLDVHTRTAAAAKLAGE
jgi:DNA-binding CsgD family transcriptional regulator